MVLYLNRLVDNNYHLQRIIVPTIGDHPSMCALFHVNIWSINLIEDYKTFPICQFNSLPLPEVFRSILILNNANPQQ